MKIHDSRWNINGNIQVVATSTYLHASQLQIDVCWVHWQATVSAITFTNASIAFWDGVPLTAVQASHLALPSKSSPPFSAHIGLSSALSPLVACMKWLQRTHTRKYRSGT